MTYLDEDRIRAVARMNATRDTRDTVHREIRETVAALMAITTTDLITDREKWSSLAAVHREAADTIDRIAAEHDRLTM